MGNNLMQADLSVWGMYHHADIVVKVVMIGLILAGQIGSGLVLDHFGLLGYTQKLINWQRVLGAVLVGVGVFLIRRF